MSDGQMIPGDRSEGDSPEWRGQVSLGPSITIDCNRLSFTAEITLIRARQVALLPLTKVSVITMECSYLGDQLF